MNKKRGMNTDWYYSVLQRITDTIPRGTRCLCVDGIFLMFFWKPVTYTSQTSHIHRFPAIAHKYFSLLETTSQDKQQWRHHFYDVFHIQMEEL